MRHVYTSREVAHLWAHQSQDSARNSSNSVSFDGAILHSYSTAIACIIDGVVYVSSDNMSVTTSKHIGYALRATRHMERFYTPAFRWGGGYPQLTHDAMLQPAAATAIRDLERALANAKTRKKTKMNAVAEYISEKQRILAQAKRFRVKIKMPEMALDEGCLESYQAKKDKADKAAERARLKAAKLQQIKDAEQYQVWLTTGAGRFPSSYHERDSDKITVQGAEVLTSQGVRVPLDHVVRALRFWLGRGLEYHGKTGQCLKWVPWAANGHTVHIGVYSLTSIDEAGTCKIGCHTFQADTLERFIEQWRDVLGL